MADPNKRVHPLFFGRIGILQQSTTSGSIQFQVKVQERSTEQGIIVAEFESRQTEVALHHYPKWFFDPFSQLGTAMQFQLCQG